MWASAWTSSPTHRDPGYDQHSIDEGSYDAAIDDVVARVYTGFTLSNTDGSVEALKRGRPSIPSDVDRALLLDLSDSLGQYNIPEAVRFRLRA